ncbi:hypothetical protein B0H13DRAFT_1661221, partial [Mycena leptocephala]
WHHTEHASHLAMEGVLSGLRYKAIDGKEPVHLALYEADIPLTDIASASEGEFLAMAKREASAYTLLSCRTRPNMRPADVPAEFLYLTGMDITPAAEDAVNEWYGGEHTDLFMRVPGWLRVRRYRLHQHSHQELGERLGRVPHKYLAVHELNNAEFTETPEYTVLASTERAKEMKERLLGIEIRVFELQR